MDEIKKLLKAGGLQNYQNALEIAATYYDNGRLFLYFYILRSGTQVNSKEILVEIFNYINSYYYINGKFTDLKEIFPISYLFLISSKIPTKFIHLLLEKTTINYEDINQILSLELNNYELRHLLLYVDKVNDLGDKKNRIHFNIFCKSLKNQDFKYAKLLADKAAMANDNDLILKDISILYFENNLIEDGIRIANKINDFEIWDIGEETTSPLTEIAIKLLKLGEIEKGLSFVQLISSHIGKISALLEASCQLTQIGEQKNALLKLEEAIIVSNGIQFTETKIEVIQKIYTELLNQGYKQKSIILVKKTIEMVRTSEISYKGYDLLEIAFFSSSCGMQSESEILIDEAIELFRAKDITSLFYLFRRLEEQGRVKNSTKLFQELSNKIELIQNSTNTYRYLDDISIGLVKINKTELANKILKMSPITIDKLIALKGITFFYSEKGECEKTKIYLDEFLESVKVLEGDSDSVLELSFISTELFNRGFFEESDILIKEILNKIDNYNPNNKKNNNYNEDTIKHNKDFMREEIIWQLLYQGKSHMALSLTQRFNDVYNKKSSLNRIYSKLICQEEISFVEEHIWHDYWPF